MFWDSAVGHMVASLIYSLIGVVVFAASFFILEKLSPFSIHKELAEDDNVAVGIVLGAMVIGLSIIIAAAIG